MALNESPINRKCSDYKCLFVKTLNFLPYKRCVYCDKSFFRCFGGFQSPIIVLAITLLVFWISQTSHPVVNTILIIFTIGLLILLIALSNCESSELAVNNYSLNQAQKLLKLEKEKYHLLYSSLPGGSFMVDKDYIIRDVNEILCNVTNYERDELIGSQCNVICPKGPHRCPIFDLNKPKIDNDETAVKRKDGTFVPIIKCARRIKLDDQDFIIENFQDITNLKLAERQIKSSLKEKNILLQEIHHRVKNNLQIISSLIYLQSRRLKDEQTVQMFQETQNRVKSMALVHEKLYMSDNLVNIDFKGYIQNLTKNLFHSYKINSHIIKLIIDIDNVMLTVNSVLTCGMIINELVSNSLKYAFDDAQQGEIHIQLTHSKDNNNYILSVSDTGKSFPVEETMKKNDSLGLKLVWTFVEQLGGTISTNENGGTSYLIQFRDN